MSGNLTTPQTLHRHYLHFGVQEPLYNNHLKFFGFKFFLLRLCQCWLLKGGPRTTFVKMVLSWQWSTCEATFVIFILCICGLFGFDSHKKIIKPIQQNSVNPTHTGPYGCLTVRYARLSGSPYTDIMFLQVTICYCAYTVNSNLDILLWCHLSNTVCMLFSGLCYLHIHVSATGAIIRHHHQNKRRK